MVTEQEARDMKAAIEAFEKKDADAAKAKHDADLARAQHWFNTLPEHDHEPMSRDEAKFMFDNIKQLLTTETDRYRRAVLSKELQLANEKYKEVKRNG